MNIPNNFMITNGNKVTTLQNLACPFGLQFMRPIQSGGKNQYTKISHNDSPYIESEYSKFLSIINQHHTKLTKKKSRRKHNSTRKKSTKKHNSSK